MAAVHDALLVLQILANLLAVRASSLALEGRFAWRPGLPQEKWSIWLSAQGVILMLTAFVASVLQGLLDRLTSYEPANQLPDLIATVVSAVVMVALGYQVVIFKVRSARIR